MAYLPNPNVEIADGPNLDAFSRLRVGIPKLRLSCLFDSDKRPLFWDESLTAGGTATFQPNESCVYMTVTNVGDIALRQTKEYFVYRAAQSQLIFCTFVMDTEDANVLEELGYFDDEDGLFLRRQGTSVSVVQRSYVSGAPVDTAVAQASWNLDPLDGTGPSGILLDLTKIQIFGIDFQGLGAGRVRYFFNIDGSIVYFHENLNVNHSLTTVFLRRLRLPIRYRIEATGAPGAARTLKQISSTVIREGGDDEPGVETEGRSNASVNVGVAWKTVLGVRLKTSNLRAAIRLLGVQAFNLSAVYIEFMVILNPTYAGAPVWVPSDPVGIAEISRFNATISVNAAGDPTVGHVYSLGGYVPGSSGTGVNTQVSVPTARTLEEGLPIVANIAGTPDEAWLCVRASSGTADVLGILQWEEER